MREGRFMEFERQVDDVSEWDKMGEELLEKKGMQWDVGRRSGEERLHCG